MEPVFIYGSTVVVLWAVLAMPLSLEKGRADLAWISGFTVFLGQLYFTSEKQPFPMNVFVAAMVMLLATGGGYLKYILEHKSDKGQR